MSRLGDLLRTERLRRNMTLKQVARLGGVSEEYLKDVESRKTLVEEHYAVYRALKARNQQQAVKDICIHIVNQQDAILRSLEQMNKEEQPK